MINYIIFNVLVIIIDCTIMVQLIQLDSYVSTCDALVRLFTRSACIRCSGFADKRENVYYPD